MPVKIVLVGAKLSKNLGGPSLLLTTKRVLGKFLIDAHYTLISPTAEDLALAKTYHVKIVPGSFIRSLHAFLSKRFLGAAIGSKNKRDLVNTFVKADIIIDIWGILFCDSLRNNRFTTRALEGLHLFLGKLFCKPVVKYTADIGPFESKWNRFFAKLYMQHFVDLILARNDITKKRLLAIGVSTPIVVHPDTAFLLEAHNPPFAKRISLEKASHPIVGFSVSYQTAQQSGNADAYLENIAGLADHIMGHLKAKVILIPNELSDNHFRDDGFVVHEIFRRISKKEGIIFMSHEYNAWQIKGIIGQCDVIVASRYHSIVAALSQAIPVLAVGWHDKYPEVLRLVGQEKHLCAVKSSNLADLRDKFDSLWHNRARIRNEIKAELPPIVEKIFQGGKKVYDLLKKIEC